MNYTKLTKSVEIITRCESTANGDVYSLMELEQKKTIHANGVIVPFHAVDTAVVTVTTEEASKADSYFCDGGDGDCDNLVGSALVGCSKVG